MIQFDCIHQGDCLLHSDCAWDKKCVLAPLPLSHPDSGSIFVYKCITRLQYNNNEYLRQEGKFNILIVSNIIDNYIFIDLFVNLYMLMP